jgi:hypothetical protein
LGAVWGMEEKEKEKERERERERQTETERERARWEREKMLGIARVRCRAFGLVRSGPGEESRGRERLLCFELNGDRGLKGRESMGKGFSW